MSKDEDGFRKRSRPSLDQIERDFNDAIDRLIARTPQNGYLRDLASKGLLKINSQTVSMEAGRSRTLISLENCRLPRIRDRIVALNKKRPYSRRQGYAAEASELRREIAELKDQLASALEGQAQHFLAREDAEREAAKWRDAFRRQTEERKGATNVSPLRPSPRD